MAHLEWIWSSSISVSSVGRTESSLTNRSRIRILLLHRRGNIRAILGLFTNGLGIRLVVQASLAENTRAYQHYRQNRVRGTTLDHDLPAPGPGNTRKHGRFFDYSGFRV